MAEKFKYGPLVYNCFGEDDDSGNYWWAGAPPVAYEEPSGPFRMPVDEYGNQCLPGNCILHPNCSIDEWESFELFPVPSLPVFFQGQLTIQPAQKTKNVAKIH